ncbi:MAG: beta-lactamase family protein [Bacilli bacterium]|nr:beta-lactamase family protein [Bacilli bacterium]
MKEEVITKLQQYIDKISKKVKGVSVVLTNRETNIFEYCNGIVDENESSNNPDRMFSIGSNTKLLTTIAIFQLIEQGALDLDKDIKEYIPEFEVQSHEPFEKITIRQILMHRSGLQGDDYRLFFDESKTQKDDLLPAIQETYLCAQPGTMYAYSNLGYGLLGIIIERVSKESYIDYIKKHVFDPLELGMMILPTVKEREPNKDRISQGFDQKGKVVKEDLTSITAAGSSTYASLHDMAKLLRFFLNPEKQTLLSQSSMKQILETPPAGMYLKGEANHGLGISHNGMNYYNEDIGLSIGHGGATWYHFSAFQMIPKQGIGIAVMSNTHGSNAINVKIGRKVAEEYLKSIDTDLTTKPDSVDAYKTNDIEKYIDTIVCFGRQYRIKAKNQTLQTNVKFLEAQILIDENDEYHFKPIGIAKLPIFSKALMNMSLIRKEKDSKVIYYGKQYLKHSYNIAAIGTSKKWIDETSNYQYLQGKYKRVTPLPTDETFAKNCRIKVTNNDIILSAKLEEAKVKLYLYPITDTLFQIQGYGRYALTTVSINHDSSSTCITFFGLTMKKC